MIRIVILLAFLATPAAAMSKAELNALVMRGNHAPPAKFDHYPTIPFKLDVVPHWQIELVCGKSRLQARPACTSTGPKGTWIFVSDWLRGRALKIVLRHEYGHVNAYAAGTVWNHR